MSIRLAGDARGEWRQHWPVVMAGAIAVATSTMNSYSLGLFVEPIEREFGWSRAQIMAGGGFAAVSAVVLGPFVGAAIDRVGPRRLGIAGIAALCALTALLALTGPGIGSWWTVWILIALITPLTNTTVWTAAASGLFAAGRGMALAVMLCGSGIGSLVIPVLAYELIERFGWRLAYPAMAACFAAVALPAIVLFFTSVRDQERTGERAPGVERTRTDRAVLRQLLSARFVKLILAAFLIAAVIVPIVVNIVPILTSTGLGRGEAAGVAALLGLSSIAGRLTIGFLLDRLDGRFLAASSVLLPIASVALLLAVPGSVAAAAGAVLLLGLALGAEYDIVAYLTSRYFSVRHFGLFFGTIGGAVTLAGGAGPVVISAVYDSLGTYRPVLFAVIPVCLVCALLFLLLGRYPAAQPAAAVTGGKGPELSARAAAPDPTPS